MIYFEETRTGFTWGAAKLTRGFCDSRKGWVTLILTTPKHQSGIQIYVTKSGKVRVFDKEKEWK